MLGQKGLLMIAVAEAMALITGYTYMNSRNGTEDIGKLEINLDDPKIAIEAETVSIQGASMGSMQSKYFDRSSSSHDSSEPDMQNNSSSKKQKDPLPAGAADLIKELMKRNSDTAAIEEAKRKKEELKTQKISEIENISSNPDSSELYCEGSVQIGTLSFPSNLLYKILRFKDGDDFYIELLPKNIEQTSDNDNKNLIISDVTFKKGDQGKSSSSYSVYALTQSKFEVKYNLLAFLTESVYTVKKNKLVEDIAKFSESNKSYLQFDGFVKILITPKKK